jgi:polyisoprenyl-phosphate glycosyltransferase
MTRNAKSAPRVTVVLPLLNEGEILSTLANELQQTLDATHCDWNILFVNDGSTDDSGTRLELLASENNRIQALHLSRNFGHSAAVRAGLDHVDADAVIVMDCDGQDDPRAIGLFLEQWKQGAQVVYATRVTRKEALWKRFLFSSFYRVLNRISSMAIPKDAGNFSLMDRCVVEQIRALPEVDRYLPGLRSWVGFRQVAVPVARLERYDSKPRVRLRGLVSLAKTALFGFSRVPLHAFYGLASVCALVCMFCIGFTLFHKLFTGLAIPGWTSMTCVSAFFGAMNALGIAILGEYVARIYDQVRCRASYIVARTTNLPTTRKQGDDLLLADVDQLHELALSATTPRGTARHRESSNENHPSTASP